MMPLEHETIIMSGGSANSPASHMANNFAVHTEPPGSMTNVRSCSDEQIPSQSSANTLRFSVLRQSLRPVILKVRMLATINL